jgi:hypothetical protein
VGEESIDIADRRSAIADFCRQVEIYLCQKNDGHLIRVVGPSFELVSKWAEQGVPLKVAYAGIDRYFERYYRHGPRRRPVKIDFCEADVLDVFDEWRRAVGIAGARANETGGARAVQASGTAARQSLPAHLERVVTRLSSARASGVLGDRFDALIDRVSAELDAARAKAGGVRGDARRALIDRLNAIDASLLAEARTLLDDETRAALAKEADDELAGFRATMTADAYARARAGAIDRLVRERFNLPTLAFTA